jgi:hypothetical protein
MIDCAALSKVFTRMSDSHESSTPRAKRFQTAANWPNCPPPPSFANKSFGDNIDCFAMSAALHVVFEPLHGCDCRPRNSAQGEDAGRAGVVTPRPRVRHFTKNSSPGGGIKEAAVRALAERKGFEPLIRL